MSPATGQPSSRRSRTTVTLVATLLGVAVLVWQIQYLGLGVLWRNLSAVGVWFAAILAISLLRFVTRSAAWIALIGEPVPVTRALAATISGDALGNATPFSLLVSEPAKALYLGAGVPSSRSLAALAAENFFYSVSVALYVILGTAAMLARFQLPDAVRWAGEAALVLMAAVLVAAGWLAWQKPSVATTVVARLPIAKLNAVVARLREFELQTYGSAGHEGGRLGVVAAWETVFHLLSFTESWLTIWLFTGQSEPLAAFVLDATSRVINVIFRVVPFRIGVDQATAGAVAQAVGLTQPIGVAQALVRTGRMVVWAVVGAALLAQRGLQRQGQRAESEGQREGRGEREQGS
jgi:Lysylphosphatidylglycerol synthase TM region